MGHRALALTDEDGLYGVVKGHLAAKELGFQLIIGSWITLTDAPSVVVFVQNSQGYQNLCNLVSRSRLAHPKGKAGLSWRELAERSQGLIALLPFPSELKEIAPLSEAFPQRFYIGNSRLLTPCDEGRLAQAPN